MTRDEIRELLIARDGDACRWCGLPFKRRGKHMIRTLDHVLPKSLGGTDVPENLCLAHLFCNSVRGNDSFASFVRVARARPKRYRGGWATPAALALREALLEKEVS